MHSSRRAVRGNGPGLLEAQPASTGGGRRKLPQSEVRRPAFAARQFARNTTGGTHPSHCVSKQR